MKHSRVTAGPWVLAVFGQKGGTGKSTLSVNLAVAATLVRGGSRTLLVDLDPQGSATDWYAEHTRTNGSGSLLALEALDAKKRAKYLSLDGFGSLVQGRDVVVLDGPPRLNDIAQAAAVHADVVLLPVRIGGFDWWALSESLKTLDAADETRRALHPSRPPLRRVFVLNASLPGVVGERPAALALEALRTLGETAPTVHYRHAFQVPAASGQCALTIDPESTASTEIRALYHHLRGDGALR
jgi:chromosome partitioning protein